VESYHDVNITIVPMLNTVVIYDNKCQNPFII